MNERELATVLAALRVYQEALGMNGGEPPAYVEPIACDGGLLPLSVDEIDELCERLNRQFTSRNTP